MPQPLLVSQAVTIDYGVTVVTLHGFLYDFFSHS